MRREGKHLGSGRGTKSKLGDKNRKIKYVGIVEHIFQVLPSTFPQLGWEWNSPKTPKKPPESIILTITENP